MRKEPRGIHAMSVSKEMKTYSVETVSNRLSLIEQNEWEQGMAAKRLGLALKMNPLVPEFWVTEFLGWAMASQAWLSLGIG